MGRDWVRCRFSVDRAAEAKGSGWDVQTWRGIGGAVHWYQVT